MKVSSINQLVQGRRDAWLSAAGCLLGVVLITTLIIVYDWAAFVDTVLTVVAVLVAVLMVLCIIAAILFHRDVKQATRELSC